MHVMIRNMDTMDEDSGYYVMSIDLVDTSNYSLKYATLDEVVIYEVPEELRDFIIEHLLLDLEDGN